MKLQILLFFQYIYFHLQHEPEKKCKTQFYFIIYFLQYYIAATYFYMCSFFYISLSNHTFSIIIKVYRFSTRTYYVVCVCIYEFIVYFDGAIWESRWCRLELYIFFKNIKNKELCICFMFDIGKKRGKFMMKYFFFVVCFGRRLFIQTKILFHTWIFKTKNIVPSIVCCSKRNNTSCVFDELYIHSRYFFFNFSKPSPLMKQSFFFNFEEWSILVCL